MAKQPDDKIVERNGRFHVYRYGNYYAHFESKRRAENALRGLQGEPLLPGGDLPAKPPRKHGLYKNEKTGYWSVYYKDLYYGVYQFKLSAAQKLKALKEIYG